MASLQGRHALVTGGGRGIGRAIAAALTVAGAAVAFAGGGATDPEVAAALTNPPNILYIVTDDQRLDGTMVMMPQTKAWFEQGGTFFPQMVDTTPLCCPSRSSIFTGRYVHNTGVRTNESATFLRRRRYARRGRHGPSTAPTNVWPGARRTGWASRRGSCRTISA